jgi:hypothetical protein
METQQLILALYDFVTCQRGDGTFYGNGGGKCHKGEESPLPEASKKTLSPKLSRALEAYSDKIDEVWGDGFTQKIKGTMEEFYQAKRDYKEKIDSGNLTREDLLSIYKNNQYTIPNSSEVAFFGMEPANSMNGDSESLANLLALAKMNKDGILRESITGIDQLLSYGPEEANFGRDVSSGTYVFKMSDLSERFKSAPSGKSRKADIFREGLLSNGNFSPIPATGQSQKEWEDSWGDLLTSQKRSAELEVWKNRTTHDAEFTPIRRRTILSEVSRAYREGNLKLAASFPGTKYSKDIMEIVATHKNSGGRVFKNKADFGERGNTTGKDVYVLEMAKGKYFVLSPIHPNTQGWKTSVAEQAIRESMQKADSGLLEEV